MPSTKSSDFGSHCAEEIHWYYFCSSLIQSQKLCVYSLLALPRPLFSPLRLCLFSSFLPTGFKSFHSNATKRLKIRWQFNQISRVDFLLTQLAIFSSIIIP